MKTALRLSIACLIVTGLVAFLPKPLVFADPEPSISLNVQNAGPRTVEDTTERSVARDYAAAWKAMEQALDQNRTDLLGPNFTGTANDKLTASILQQRKSGLHQQHRGQRTQRRSCVLFPRRLGHGTARHRTSPIAAYGWEQCYPLRRRHVALCRPADRRGKLLEGASAGSRPRFLTN